MPVRVGARRALQRKPRPRKPYPVSGIFLAIFADDLNPLLPDAGAVSAWPEQSGYGYHGVQATGTRQPTLRKNQAAFNGHSVVRFDGGDWVDFPTPSQAQPATYYAVALVTGTGTTQQIIGTQSGGQHALYVDSANHFAIYNGAVVQAGSAVVTGTPHIFSQIAQDPNDQSFMDNVQVVLAASGSDVAGPLRIGANLLGASFLTGDVAAILAYRGAHSASERQAVYTFLSEYYGVPRVKPFTRRFHFGALSDRNLQTAASFANMLNDLGNIGLDAVMFTNGATSAIDELAAVSDPRGVPIWVGPLSQLHADFNTDLAAVAAMGGKHPSLRGYYLWDEPTPGAAGEPSIAQMSTWNTALKTANPDRDVFEVLIGTDRVQAINTGANPTALVIDVYPCGLGDPELSMLMTGFGYTGTTMAQYLATVLTGNPVGRPVYMILQTHGLAAVDLRVPTIPEIHAQFWTAVGMGANAIFWFTYETQQGWTGLESGGNAIRAALLDIARNHVNDDIRVALRDTIKVSDEWQATNGCEVRTLANLDATRTGAGDIRYVSVHNPTTITRQTGLSPVNVNEAHSLLKMIDGTQLPGVSTNLYSLLPGRGLIFKTNPASAATGVPLVPINANHDVEAWWAAHPLNEVANGAYTVSSPGVIATLASGASIQAAIDAAPVTGGTIKLAAGGSYQGFKLYKSNIHFVCDDPVNRAKIITAGTETNTDPTIFMGPAAATIEPVTAYGDFNLGVDTKSEPWLTYFLNPLTNIYYKNIDFDGGGIIVRPVTATCLRRVMFDNCRWINLADNTGGFHWGSWTSNVRNENLYFRNCRFGGAGRWATYVDGGHGCVVVGCTMSTGYGSGGFLFLNNDDFSYDENGDNVQDLFEQRSARYCVISNCSTDGFIYQFQQCSGGDNLIENNHIVQTYQCFAFTARGSNKWAQINGLRYDHYGNVVKNNQIDSVVDGPLLGAQGLIYMGAAHCGWSNTPSSFWQDPANYGKLGRLGRFKAINNVVTGGPTALVLVMKDEVATPPYPYGKVEGYTESANTISGNTKAGSPLT